MVKKKRGELMTSIVVKFSQNIADERRLRSVETASINPDEIAKTTIEKIGVNELSKKELRLFTKILSSDGHSDFFYGKLIYKKFKQKQKGIELMEEAILKNNNPKKVRQLAFFYINDANYIRAEELFKFNIQNEPYRYQARMDLVKLYRKTNQLKKLKPLLKEVIDFPVKIPSDKVNEYKKSCLEILSSLK